MPSPPSPSGNRDRLAAGDLCDPFRQRGGRVLRCQDALQAVRAADDLHTQPTRSVALELILGAGRRVRARLAGFGGARGRDSSPRSPVTFGIFLSIANEIPSRARNRRPKPDPNGHLDRLEPDAEGEAVAIRNAVRQQSDGDCHLEEAEGAGPQGERQRNVDDEEDQRGGRDRLIDLECSHGEVDGEELRRPAKQLEEAGRQRRARRMEDAQSAEPLMHQPPYSPEPVQRPDALAPWRQASATPASRSGRRSPSMISTAGGPTSDTRGRR